jgi:hypothetical protein
MKRARLEECRQVAYIHLSKAHDAIFELTDAILLSLPILDFRFWILDWKRD